MKRPFAIPTDNEGEPLNAARRPRAFSIETLPAVPPEVESLSDPGVADEDVPVAIPRASWLARLLWTTGAALVSLALGLAADNLIRNLFEAQPWLGWVGLAVLGLFVLAVIALIVRETSAVMRLRGLDTLKRAAAEAIASDNLKAGKSVLAELHALYDGRPDLARAARQLTQGAPHLFDGAEIVRFSERTLMAPLDARARTLTAASARRVALVTAVSPRALVDVAFVIWESVRLSGAIARLYGARPGLWSTWRLIGAILGHLAVTGGLVLTDGIVEQLVGQGLAARLSQRLGEGVVNGLMTVRVGIAAMRVVRPLPFATERQPMVRDFVPELANVLKKTETS